MAHLHNLNPKTLQRLRKLHDKLYCKAKLSGIRLWSINDTLEELMDNYGDE